MTSCLRGTRSGGLAGDSDERSPSSALGHIPAAVAAPPIRTQELGPPPRSGVDHRRPRANQRAVTPGRPSTPPSARATSRGVPSVEMNPAIAPWWPRCQPGRRRPSTDFRRNHFSEIMADCVLPTVAAERPDRSRHRRRPRAAAGHQAPVRPLPVERGAAPGQRRGPPAARRGDRDRGQAGDRRPVRAAGDRRARLYQLPAAHRRAGRGGDRPAGRPEPRAWCRPTTARPW